MKSVAAGLGAVLLLAGTVVAIQVRSQRILDARQPLRPSAVRADGSLQAVVEGAHFVQVTACGRCHGSGLTGKMLTSGGSPLYAPNLTLVVARRSDADLDRAIRAGVHPDGTSELGMPSHVYAGFTDAQMSAMLGYLRRLEPQGALLERPGPGFLQRADLAAGVLHTEAQRVAAAHPPLDLGPRFDAGRRLASVACGQCHGADLAGGGRAPGPDLTVRGYYDRGQFHALLQKGETPSGRDLQLMSETARASFSHFSDAEIDAIFDYLDARDLRLGAK